MSRLGGASSQHCVENFLEVVYALAIFSMEAHWVLLLRHCSNRKWRQARPKIFCAQLGAPYRATTRIGNGNKPGRKSCVGRKYVWKV